MINVEGMRFGRLKIICKTHKDKSGDWKVDCVCDCGNKSNTRLASLRRGYTKSCGCLSIERSTKHGHNSKLKGMSPTYISWLCMKQRCTNRNHENFKSYGEKGISFSKSWAKFENFLADMGERPKGKTIDRIDNNMGYSKENCRRATSKEQNCNRKSNHIIEYEGVKYTLKDLSIKIGVKRTTLSQRIKNWGLEKALKYKKLDIC